MSMICGFMVGFVFELRVAVFVGLCVRYGGQAGFGPVVVDVCAQRVGQFLVFVCVFGIPVCGWPFVFRLSFAGLFGVVCSSGVVRGGVVWCAVGGFVVQCRGFGGLSVLFPSSRVSWLFCVVVCWV